MTYQPVTAISGWYLAHRRDLPWRAPDRTPWGVLVSEVMLQQTPVSRVRDVWEAWLSRWPTPTDLALESPAEVIRAWGRLGYPRRALRLQAAAAACVDRFGGQVPTTYDQLRTLPGVGDYTAAAVLSFAYGRRAVVLDTNVRRVLARHQLGRAQAGPSVTVAERALANALLPADESAAALWSVAIMELGALVCTSAAPRCGDCPVSADCAWFELGQPPYDGPERPKQKFAGTDRQVRGLLLSVLRESRHPVPRQRLDLVWPDAIQRERALAGLVADGLVEPLPRSRYRLPTGVAAI
jgi:A/G-specific adenine glycosylase